MFDLTSLAWGVFVSIFSVILTVHTRLLTLDRILGRGGGWSINPRLIRDATNQIFLSNYFTFQLKKYSILKDKWINISIYVSCILSASLFTDAVLFLWSLDFTVDRVQRHHSVVFAFVLSPAVQRRTYPSPTRMVPLLFPVPLQDATVGGLVTR